MPHTQTAVHSHEAAMTAEVISDEQVAGLLEATANHEVKALTLLAMEAGQDYGPSQLRNAVLDLLGSRAERLVGHASIKQYNTDSFAPNGLVKLSSGGNRFELTDYGDTYGRAMAGFASSISLDAPDDISLRRLLGLTHSTYPDERPPFHRYQLLKTLIDGKEHTIMGMVRGFDSAMETTSHRLGVMEEDGLLTSDMRPPRGAQFTIRSIGALANFAARNRAGSITKEIDLAMKDVAEIAPETVFWTREVYEHATDNLGREEGRKTFENVKDRLDRLKQAGVLEQLDLEETREVLYQIQPGAVSSATALVEMVDLLKTDPGAFLRLGNKMADEILNDRALMKKLVAKGRANSPQTNNDYANR